MPNNLATYNLATYNNRFTNNPSTNNPTTYNLTANPNDPTYNPKANTTQHNS